MRGADRSGGFLEADDDAGRTEQLADIFIASTANGNHGWAELRVRAIAAPPRDVISAPPGAWDPG